VASDSDIEFAEDSSVVSAEELAYVIVMATHNAGEQCMFPGYFMFPNVVRMAIRGVNVGNPGTILDGDPMQCVAGAIRKEGLRIFHRCSSTGRRMWVRTVTRIVSDVAARSGGSAGPKVWRRTRPCDTEVELVRWAIGKIERAQCCVDEKWSGPLDF